MKKIIITLIFVVAYLCALPQYYDEQRIHFYGTEIGSCSYPSSGLSQQYKDLGLDNSMYFRLNTLALSGTLFGKKNKSGRDYRALFVYTGLAFQWNSYYFDDDVRITKGTENLLVSKETQLKTKSSKLVATYITFPLMFEYQFDSNWFLVTGIDSKIRIGSYAKYVYWNEEGKKERAKNRDKFWLAGYQPDLVARFGWNFISLDFKYGLRPLFQKGRGPDVSTYTLGLMIAI